MKHKCRGENQVSQVAIILAFLGFKSLFSSSNEFGCVLYIKVLIFRGLGIISTSRGV